MDTSLVSLEWNAKNALTSIGVCFRLFIISSNIHPMTLYPDFSCKHSVILRITESELLITNERRYQRFKSLL